MVGKNHFQELELRGTRGKRRGKGSEVLNNINQSPGLQPWEPERPARTQGSPAGPGQGDCNASAEALIRGTQSLRAEPLPAPTLRRDRLNGLGWSRHQHKVLLFPSNFYKAFMDLGQPQDNTQPMVLAEQTMGAKRQVSQGPCDKGHEKN